jgi:hypothetical protein
MLAGWALTDKELDLEGEHPEFGTVTLRQRLATWVAHDLAHLGQISRVMAKEYREAVGQWRGYLERDAAVTRRSLNAVVTGDRDTARVDCRILTIVNR